MIDVRAPLRGAVQIGDAETIEVRGFVYDDSHATLRVNGVPARIATDGSFAATVPATPGITLIHVVATDAGHNEGRDTRAVLGGTLVDARTPAVDGIVARLDARAVRAGAWRSRVVSARSISAPRSRARTHSTRAPCRAWARAPTSSASCTA